MGVISVDLIRSRASPATLQSYPFFNSFDTDLSAVVLTSSRHLDRMGPPRCPRVEGDGDPGRKPVTGPKLSVSFRLERELENVRVTPRLAVT
jgi:hypothetical protein